MNKNKVRILVPIVTGVLLLAGGLVGLTSTSKATSQDSCYQLFTYEKSGDFDDARIHINFESSDEQIDVSAQSGYSITRVWLDVDNDGHSGYFQYSSGPMNNFNPNPGNDIEEAKVEVKKVCASPSPSPSPEQSPSPSGMRSTLARWSAFSADVSAVSRGR